MLQNIGQIRDLKQAQIKGILQDLSKENTVQQQIDAYNLLYKLIKNISENPKEQKYRSFKQNNQKISDFVLSLKPSHQILSLISEIGFNLTFAKA